MTSAQKTNAPSSARPNAVDFGVFLSITLFGAALDIGSKYAVFNWLKETPAGQHIFIDGFLRFILAENPGAAFSLFAGMTWLFIAISIAALVVINGMFIMGKLKPPLMLVALACMNAGVIGNFYDRLFNDGYVRDFIDVSVGGYHWPTFNVADILLCIGAGLILFVSLTGHSPDND